jgi:ribosome-associated protein YbcJ (S4-like RNA binding protein)
VPREILFNEQGENRRRMKNKKIRAQKICSKTEQEIRAADGYPRKPAGIQGI